MSAPRTTLHHMPVRPATDPLETGQRWMTHVREDGTVVYTASSLGACARALVADRRRKVPYYPTDRQNAIFAAGWRLEDTVCDLLHEAGFEVTARQGDYEIAVAPGIVVTGHIDGIITTPDGREFVGEFKAQPITEPILTPSGWEQMGNITIGSRVIGSDGLPTVVTNITTRGNRPNYRVNFSDRSFVHCDEDHLWAIESRGKRVIRSTRELCLGDRLPLLSPIEMPIGDLPLHPYLLGTLLGNGFFNGTSPSISSSHRDLIEEITPLLPMGVQVKKNAGLNHSWDIIRPGGDQFDHNPLMDILRKLGLHKKRAWEKFVPLEYLHGSIHQRLSLLQGLLDTDGNCYKGTVSFSSTSHALADAVVALTRSLGGTSHEPRQRPASKNGAWAKRDIYVCNLSLPTEFQPFRLARKARQYIGRNHRLRARRIVSVEPAGQAEMQCLTVENADGLYVTRDYALTHNSMGPSVYPAWARNSLKALNSHMRYAHQATAAMEGMHLPLFYVCIQRDEETDYLWHHFTLDAPPLAWADICTRILTIEKMAARGDTWPTCDADVKGRALCSYSFLHDPEDAPRTPEIDLLVEEAIALDRQAKDLTALAAEKRSDITDYMRSNGLTRARTLLGDVTYSTYTPTKLNLAKLRADLGDEIHRYEEDGKPIHRVNLPRQTPQEKEETDESARKRADKAWDRSPTLESEV